MTASRPGLFIVGFTKCATSSLHKWLVHHPEIAGGARKELEYLYDRESYFYRAGESYHDLGLEGYKTLFPDADPDAIWLDSTPAYAYHKTALDVIAAMDPAPVCVFVTRDPIEHLRSTYHYFSNNKLYIPSDISLERFMEMAVSGEAQTAFPQDHLKHALAWARFEDWMTLWRDALPADRIVELDMRAMLANPAIAVTRVLDALGLDAAPYSGYDFPGENETYYVRSRSVQRVNTLVRRLIPKGAVYDRMRALYRRLNGSGAKPVQADLPDSLLQRLEMELS